MQFDNVTVTRVNAASFLRLLHRAVPLERRFYSLIRRYQNQAGLLSVPWGEFNLHFPGSWLASACDAVYKRPESNNPEFFELLAPLATALRHGAIVDVGAALGVYILNFRALTDRPIIAYEPSPLAFALAEYNVRTNALRDVRIRNVACGDSDGWVQLASGINSVVLSSRSDVSSFIPADEEELESSDGLLGMTISAPLVRLDDDLRSAGPVGLLKIDCEGFEYQVLAGAAELIEHHRPIIFVELHPHEIGKYGHSVADVCTFLAPNYDLEFWDYLPTERSGHPMIRLLGRYRQSGSRYSCESAMLQATADLSGPSQVFLLARPK